MFAIVSVWTAEALNTALELLCDVASPEFHPLIETAKDVAAGAVLICAAGAMVIAGLYSPRICPCFFLDRGLEHICERVA